MLNQLTQNVKHFTGYGNQGNNRQGLSRYREKLMTHDHLNTLLNGWSMGAAQYNSPGNYALIDGLNSNGWYVTVVLQLFHGMKNSVLNGANGHVSMMVWNVPEHADGKICVYSFHVEYAGSAPNVRGALSVNTALYPRQIMPVRYRPDGDVDQTVEMTGVTDFTLDSSAQDIWFYTQKMTQDNATKALSRMQTHHDNQKSYGNNAYWGTRSNNQYTCLTMVDDIINFAGLSTTLSGSLSTGTPYNYRYAFWGWDCSFIPSQKMMHIIHPAHRKYVDDTVRNQTGV